MKPDTPIEALTHYAWPVMVILCSIIGWFGQRELRRIGEDIRSVIETSSEARDIAGKLQVWSIEHDKSDERQFHEAKERDEGLSGQITDVRKMVYDNENQAREREHLYRNARPA